MGAEKQMPQVNAWTVTNKELVEMIIRSAGIREGRWFLVSDFAIEGAMFAGQGHPAPGLAVAIRSLGIHRERPELKIPAEMLVDAAKLWEPGDDVPAAPVKRKRRE